MLHTVNKPPLKSNTLKSAIRIAAAGDPILLIEDAVLAVRPGAVSDPLLEEALSKHPVYALAPDLKARGIDYVFDGVEKIGYDGFVELAEQHRVVTWT